MACTLLLASCGSPPSSLPAPPGSPAQHRHGPGRCIPAFSLPLLGLPGDSPLLAVQLHGQEAAMFFSPGFVPLLFRDNGSIRFEAYRRIGLRQQDGDVLAASTTVARGLSWGRLPAADRQGYLLPDHDDRVVDGRPIVGMLGRDLLPDGAIVDLDIPGRRVTLSILQANCPNVSHLPPARSIDMQQEVLSVPVRINGQAMQAVLEPDLPVSILPRAVADRLGITDADLANDPSVVTKFGRGVLGRRHRVAMLEVGDVRLRHVAFDVEDDVRYAMLGLNVFALGRGLFDFPDRRFVFRQTTDTLPARTDLHFDETKVAHVLIDR